MPQYLKPNSDITITDLVPWRNGVNTSPCWDRLNDNPFPIVNGEIFGYSDFVGVNTPLSVNNILGLTPGIEPFTRTGYPDSSPAESGHVLRVNCSSSVTIYIQFELRQGSTVISTSSTKTIDPGSGLFTSEHYLSVAEAAAITDYSDLRFVIKDPGGNGPYVVNPDDPPYVQFPYFIESVELEIPSPSRRRVANTTYL